MMGATASGYVEALPLGACARVWTLSLCSSDPMFTEIRSMLSSVGPYTLNTAVLRTRLYTCRVGVHIHNTAVLHTVTSRVDRLRYAVYYVVRSTIQVQCDSEGWGRSSISSTLCRIKKK